MWLFSNITKYPVINLIQLICYVSVCKLTQVFSRKVLNLSPYLFSRDKKEKISPCLFPANIYLSKVTIETLENGVKYG